MWDWLVKVILRNRLLNLLIIGGLTAFMAFHALKIELSYEYAQMLPSKDSANIVYQDFKKTFEEDGSVFFVGLNDSKIRSLNVFNDWFDLTENVKKIKGVKDVYSAANCFTLVKDTAAKQFKIDPVFVEKPETQLALDSSLAKVYSLPFYDQFLFKTGTDVNIMMIWIEKEVLNTKAREDLVWIIKEPIQAFGAKHNIEIHYSGMPYIRTAIAAKVKHELKLFVLIALIIASLLLLLFFRSFRAVVFPLIIVSIGVIWTLGIMVLMGYNLTILSGIIPPILIIIGIENCIYLITKYHDEYVIHGNRIKALSRVIKRVGLATVLTNATTAVGFGSFMVTGNDILVEFGMISAIAVMLMFIFSLFLIPTFYSYFGNPKDRHIKHLDNKFLTGVIRALASVVQHHRQKVLILAVLLTSVAGFGVTRLHTTGSVVDDVPHKDVLYRDLMFFEENLSGVLPLEITIDTKKRKGVMSLSTLEKIDHLQNILLEYPAISKPLSVVEVVKFARQAFYNGNPEKYGLPNNQEKNFILSYIPKQKEGSKKIEILNSFVDTNYQIARISVRLNNLNTPEIKKLTDEIKPRIDSIFPSDRFTTIVTGSTVLYMKGTDYLVNNLAMSLILAVLLISFLMYLLFNSIRMVLISMIPNLLPQLTTAAMMGFLNIAIKPSTIIIFSIALGISVDSAIQLLSRYRHQLKINNWNVKQSMLNALSETASGMIYSGIVLVLGFSVFSLSKFGGTQALGYLIASTLAVAMLCNLIILPSLILYFDKRATTKAFKKAAIELLDDEEDELEDPKRENA